MMSNVVNRVFEDEDIAELWGVMHAAISRVTDGKGRDRHGKDVDGNTVPFNEQPLTTITKVAGIGFPLGQAMKKIHESLTASLSDKAQERELLDAIVYIAAAVVCLRNQ